MLQTHQFTVHARELTLRCRWALRLHESKREQKRWSFCLSLAMIMPPKSPHYFCPKDNSTKEVQKPTMSSRSAYKLEQGQSLQVFMKGSWREQIMLLPDPLNNGCQAKGMQHVNCSKSGSQQCAPFHPVVMPLKGNEKCKMNWRLQIFCPIVNSSAILTRELKW